MKGDLTYSHVGNGAGASAEVEEEEDWEDA